MLLHLLFSVMSPHHFLSHVTSPACLCHATSPTFLCLATRPAFHSHILHLCSLVIYHFTCFPQICHFTCFLHSCHFTCFPQSCHFTNHFLFSVTLLTDCNSEEVQVRCCRSLSNLAMDSTSRLAIAQAKALPALVKILEIQYVEVKKQNSLETTTTESGRKACDKSDENEIEVESHFPSVSMVKAACRVLRWFILGSSSMKWPWSLFGLFCCCIWH